MRKAPFPNLDPCFPKKRGLSHSCLAPEGGGGFTEAGRPRFPPIPPTTYLLLIRVLSLFLPLGVPWGPLTFILHPFALP